TENAGVVIIDLALNQALAKTLVIGGRRDVRLPVCRRIEAGVRHPERLKDFPLAEAVNRFARNFGEEFSQHDESNVAVLGAAAGLSFKWDFVGDEERFFTIVRSLKELGISGQARGVCQ